MGTGAGRGGIVSVTARAEVIEPDLLTQAFQTLRQAGFGDEQIFGFQRNPAMGLAALRAAGWTDDRLMLLAQLVPPYQAPPPNTIPDLLRRLLPAQADATRQRPTKKQPERITANWRPAEMRAAQPGQTPVTQGMVQRQQVGQVRQWAEQQANDPRVMAGLVADVLPGVGDAKAAFFDAPSLFRSGHPLAGALALASAVVPGMPGVPKPVRVYHGTSARKLTGELNPGYGIETRGAAFLTDNEDVAYTFTVPREYGEPVYYDAAGKEIKPGRVFQYDVNLKNPMVLEGKVAQEFTDNTTFQGQMVNEAKVKGHDGIIAKDVLEGIGERYRGTTYAIFDKSALVKPKKGR